MKRIALYMVAVAALVSGCTTAGSTSSPASGESASATPSAVATPSSASPSPTADQDLVPLKDQITEPAPIEMVEDDGGALAFAWYYLDIIDWALATNDASVIDAVCGPSNEQCATVTAWIKARESEGVVQYGGDSSLELGDVSSVEVVDETTRAVHLTSRGERGELRFPDGSVAGEVEPYSFAVVFTMAWQGGEWVMLAADHDN